MLEGLILAGSVAMSDPEPAWQLGFCRGEGSDTTCTRIGQPQPLEICTAMRDSMRREGVKRVVCAKVLISDE